MKNKTSKTFIIILIIVFSLLFTGLLIYGIVISNKETIIDDTYLEKINNCVINSFQSNNNIVSNYVDYNNKKVIINVSDVNKNITDKLINDIKSGCSIDVANNVFVIKKGEFILYEE